MRVKCCVLEVIHGNVEAMKGKDSIPPELKVVLSVLGGEVPPDVPWPESHPFAKEYGRKAATRERLILSKMAAHLPFSSEQAIERYSDAHKQVSRERPELFRVGTVPPKVQAALNGGDSAKAFRIMERGRRKAEPPALRRRYQKAAEILTAWMQAWFHCGKSPALLMHCHPEIEAALRRWWGAPKKFDWSMMPNGQRPSVWQAVRPSAESVACSAMWIVLTHLDGARFQLCVKCGAIYLPRTRRNLSRFCSRKCSGANALKPCMAGPERRKLEVAAELIGRAPADEWKQWVVAQTKAIELEMSLNWLTRRVKNGVLSEPGRVKERA